MFKSFRVKFNYRKVTCVKDYYNNREGKYVKA